MLKAKIWMINEGTASAEYTISIYEPSGEFIRCTGKTFKTKKGAERYAVRNNYEIM